MTLDLHQMAEAIDSITALDGTILRISKQLDAMGEDRARRMVEIREAMEAANLTSASGLLGTAALRTREVYNVEPGGWPLLQDRILKTGEFDLLQKRLSTTAVRERFDNGDVVPGVRIAVLTELKIGPKK